MSFDRSMFYKSIGVTIVLNLIIVDTSGKMKQLTLFWRVFFAVIDLRIYKYI